MTDHEHRPAFRPGRKRARQREFKKFCQQADRRNSLPGSQPLDEIVNGAEPCDAFPTQLPAGSIEPSARKTNDTFQPYAGLSALSFLNTGLDASKHRIVCTP